MFYYASAAWGAGVIVYRDFLGFLLTIFANGGIGIRAEVPGSSFGPRQAKEYVFGRVSSEIDQYFGACGLMRGGPEKTGAV